MDLLKFLSSVSLFQKLNNAALKELLNVLEVMHIQGGDALIRKGEVGDCLYVLVQGRLKVVQKNGSLEETFLGEIGIGEVVGEVAIIAQEKRSATVYAIRDSVVLKLSQEQFKLLITSYPEVLLEITKDCVSRLFYKNYKVKQGLFRTLTLAPAGGGALSKDFVLKFVAALALRGEVLHLNSSIGMPSSEWLFEQEAKYHYIIYETDSTMTPWTQLALRQSDRVLFIGEERKITDLNVIEDAFFKEKRIVESELVLLSEGNFSTSNYNRIHLNLRANVRHHHINNSSDRDFSRLIRFLCGESIGLVLSGGGARGLAHIGLVRAMEELKIPIDYVAGTSMGAVIAGGVAVGMDYKMMMQEMKERVIPAILAWDYTLPILSLKSGKKIIKACQNSFGKDLYIEDCLINFFCVSTNLSHHCMEVTQKGALWKAIISSVAIPGIFPPIINEKGDLLVDGGIVNNLPVDVMRSYINGGKIIAGSFTPAVHPNYDPAIPLDSGLSIFSHYLRGHKNKVPNMGDMILYSLMVGSNYHQIRMEKEADFCVKFALEDVEMMDFHLFDKIIDQGYEMALKQLSLEFS